MVSPRLWERRFGHISLDEGRLQMLATSDAVALKIRVNLPLTP